MKASRREASNGIGKSVCRRRYGSTRRTGAMDNGRIEGHFGRKAQIG